MKLGKLSLVGMFIFWISAGSSSAQIWDMYSKSRSSHVVEAATGEYLADTTKRDMLYTVTISSPGGQGSRIQIYDAFKSPGCPCSTNTLVDLDGRLTGTFIYAVQVSSGISYTVTAGAAAPKANFTYFLGAR